MNSLTGSFPASRPLRLVSWQKKHGMMMATTEIFNHIQSMTVHAFQDWCFLGWSVIIWYYLLLLQYYKIVRNPTKMHFVCVSSLKKLKMPLGPKHQWGKHRHKITRGETAPTKTNAKHDSTNNFKQHTKPRGGSTDSFLCATGNESISQLWKRKIHLPSYLQRGYVIVPWRVNHFPLWFIHHNPSHWEVSHPKFTRLKPEVPSSMKLYSDFSVMAPGNGGFVENLKLWTGNQPTQFLVLYQV